MVAAFDFCQFGKAGAAPSIDTAMHALVEAAHVDHLHPDSGIAIATAADGPELTRAIFGDSVVWVPWRRPGFQLGLDIAAIQREHPEAIGCILGGHGITAWGGSTSEECETNSLKIIDTAAATSPNTARPTRSVRRWPGTGRFPRPNAARRRPPSPRSSAASRRPTTPPSSATSPTPTRCSSSRARGAPAPRGARHELPPRPLLAHEDQADAARPSGRCDRRIMVARLRELHEAYRADYAAYYDRHATPDSPAMRGG